MPKRTAKKIVAYGAKCKPINLSACFNWPKGELSDAWEQALLQRVEAYPSGEQTAWGVPFKMGEPGRPRVILAAADAPEAVVKVNQNADYLCLLHEWVQQPGDTRMERPDEGRVVAEYELIYSDKTKHVQPVRGRYEVTMAESPGPAWLAMPFHMWRAMDIEEFPPGAAWGYAQTGLRNAGGAPLVYALPNPHPEKRIRALVIRGRTDSPLLVAGLTAYRGAAHPLQHLPRRTYRVRLGKDRCEIEEAEVDLGAVARRERTRGPRNAAWLKSPCAGLHLSADPETAPEDLLEIFAAPDATLTIAAKGARGKHRFSIGEAFHKGAAKELSGKNARVEVLDRKRQWMKVVIRDASTGKPTPARIHMANAQGEYIAPYGHHKQVNTGWFMDYGADVVSGGRPYAYVDGEFTTELPVGDLFVEVNKGFEYEPVRLKTTVKAGQEELTLTIRRKLDWRKTNWVTADTHVHFISPQTAWLEAQCEGVNVVNLLASQWGRLFTNVGDLSGRVGVTENDTIVYVGTENRNHMLGHMSMLGTQGLPVYPMCGGGPSESWVGDPDFRALAEWALENRRKGGVVIRPHFPYCGCTEDPAPIIKGIVDALEIRGLREEDFPLQEWYRYLNCGYKVAVCGGTDKMSAGTPVGWMRTYALLDAGKKLTYDAWAKAVRAGRTFSTTGPLIDMRVDGKRIGDTIKMKASGGKVEVAAVARSVWPLGSIEIVHNGKVAARETGGRGDTTLKVKTKLAVDRSGWVAARCTGHPAHPGAYLAAHTSPVYFQVGATRLFCAPAAQHMLSLVSGAIEYMETLATAYDESSRKRLVALFKEVQQELAHRLEHEEDAFGTGGIYQVKAADHHHH